MDKKKMLILEKEAMYMEINSGSVASGAEWLEDQKEIDFPESDLETLVRVVKRDGEWVAD
jgi:hypothetical protein